MKKIGLTFGLLMGLLMLIAAPELQAQRMGKRGGPGFGQGSGFNKSWSPAIPGLTDEQRDRIQSIRLEYARGNMDLQNQIFEKRAALRTATTQEVPDMDGANALLEEINALQLDLQKNRLQCRMAVRSELTDEQKIYFDQARGRGMGGNGAFCNNRGSMFYGRRAR